MVYPLKMCPIYQQYLWGGENLTTLGKHLPFSQVGESWELSEHPKAISTIANGSEKNKTLTEIKHIWQEKLLGNDYAQTPCPLLTKFLDAQQQLSIQVHPKPEQGGKGEAWYIISAQPGAEIIYGIKPDVSQEEFIARLNTPDLCRLFRFVPVQPGQVYYIPPGTVHSLGKGIVAAEVQQISDITYRIYDFQRKDHKGNPRPLHIPQALGCIDWEMNRQLSTNILWQQKTPFYEKTIYQTKPSFSLQTLSLSSHITQHSQEDRFTVLVCVAGKGSLHWKKETLPIQTGDTILIPAYLGEYTIEKNPQIGQAAFTLLSASPI